MMLETVISTPQKTAQTEADASAAEQTPVPETPAPKRKTLGLHPGPNRQTHQEAMEATFVQYDEALRILASFAVPDAENVEPAKP